MASPAIDGSTENHSAWHGTSSVSAIGSLSTAGTNRLVVAAIAYNGSVQRNVTAVTSSSGLTFTRRSKKSESGTNHDTIEIWTAIASAQLSAETFSITADGNVNAGSLIAFGVSGIGSLSTPWDTNSGLPYSNTASGSGNPVVTYSTDNADDLLLFFQAGDKSSAGSGATGFTIITNATNGAGAGAFLGFSAAWKSVSATQSSVATSGQTGNVTANAVAEVDSLTADIVIINVNITGVAASGAAAALTPSLASDAGAVSGAGAAAALVAEVDIAVTGVSGTGAVHALTPEVDAGLTGVAGTGVAHSVGTATDGAVSIAAAVSTAHAAPVTLGITSNVTAVSAASAAAAAPVTPSIGSAVTGVEASGAAGDVTGFAIPATYFPTVRLMRDTDVPSVGAMSNDYVASVGQLDPEGPEPPISIAVSIAGVSSGAVAAAIMPTFRVRLGITGVEGAAVAGDVGFAVT